MFDWTGTLTGTINQGMARLAATSDTVLSLAIALAAVGVAAMAITDLVKHTLRLRKLFNVLSIRMWIQGPMLAPSGAGSLHGWPAAFLLRRRDTLSRFLKACRQDDQRECVWTQLSTLATSGDMQALHALKPAALMGQVAAASRVAVTSPTEYGELLQVLVGRGGRAELNALTAASQALEAAKEEVKQAGARYRNGMAVLEEGGATSEREAADVARQVLDDAKAVEAEKQAVVDTALTRVTYFVERNIDAFQINLAARWERWNRVAAFGVSFALVLGFLSAKVGAKSALPIAVLAAFIAPVAKDVVTSLRKLRGGS